MLNLLRAIRMCVLVAALAVVTSSANAQNIVPGRLLVKFRAGVSHTRSAELLSAVSARQIKEIPALGVHVFEIAKGVDPRSFATEMKSDKGVAFAEPDAICKPCDVTPNDPAFKDWQLELVQICAPQAWAISTGSPNVTVAVLDSGVDGTNVELVGKMVPGWNAYDGNSDTTDVYGHGTKVAGVIGASSNNGLYIASVAWGCKLMPIRVTSTDGMGSYSAIAEGLVWATDHGAKVNNLSFELGASSTMQSALQYVHDHNGIVCSSAGNEGISTGLPDNPLLLTVAAVDMMAQPYSYSNYGNNVDISAPGSARTTIRNGTIDGFGGTSCATAYVSGAAALIYSVNPSLTGDQVQTILKQCALDRGPTGWDPNTGWGLINLQKSLILAGSAATGDTTPPTLGFVSPSQGATVNGSVAISVGASDNVGVASVDFYLDQILAHHCSGGVYAWSWDSTSSINGQHVVSAIAKDAAGNASQASLNVTVSNSAADVLPPVIAIVSPLPGDKIGGTMKVTVTAKDNVGVVRVDAYLDGQLVASSTTAPFSLQWSTRSLPAGQHTLQCKAIDAAGNAGASASISLKK